MINGRFLSHSNPWQKGLLKGYIKFLSQKVPFCTKASRCKFPMKFPMKVHRKYHNFIGKFIGILHFMLTSFLWNIDFIGNFLWSFIWSFLWNKDFIGLWSFPWSFLWKLHFQAFVFLPCSNRSNSQTDKRKLCYEVENSIWTGTLKPPPPLTKLKTNVMVDTYGDANYRALFFHFDFVWHW